jgi:hypothetical protein
MTDVAALRSVAAELRRRSDVAERRQNEGIHGIAGLAARFPICLQKLDVGFDCIRNGQRLGFAGGRMGSVDHPRPRQRLRFDTSTIKPTQSHLRASPAFATLIANQPVGGRSRYFTTLFDMIIAPWIEASCERPQGATEAFRRLRPRQRQHT